MSPWERRGQSTYLPHTHTRTNLSAPQTERSLLLPPEEVPRPVCPAKNKLTFIDLVRRLLAGMNHTVVSGPNT